MNFRNNSDEVENVPQPTEQASPSSGELSVDWDAEPTVALCYERDEGPWLIEGAPACEPQIRYIEQGETVVVGTCASAGIRVFDAAVSRRHCSLALEHGRMVVRDLGSKNGVFIGGARVESASLGPGGTLTVGRTVLTCHPTSTVTADAEPATTVPGVVATSLAMRRVVRELVRVAPVKGAVHFWGETGAGKDALARAMHELGPRRQRPYVPLNVGTLPRELADAELFGHERGAFTGAVGARDGAFVEAHGGTLFLDEIAELPLDMQVKLLRVLEDGEVRPLGARNRRKVDVRIASATWAPLEKRIAERLFRLDLYQRLSVFVIRVPPLRERRADLPDLARMLLRKNERETGPRELSSAALSKLTGHQWPGNVRELSNVLYRAALRNQGRIITSRDIAESLAAADGGPRVPMSRDQAEALVQVHGGNVSAAARQAGVARSTFRGWRARAGKAETPAPTAGAATTDTSIDQAHGERHST